MAPSGEEDKEWAPKTRDDWKGLFSESFKDAVLGIRSADEEAAAKNQGGTEDKTGGNDGGNGSGGGKGKSFADKLLGI